MEIPAEFFVEVVELTVTKRTVPDSVDMDFVDLQSKYVVNSRSTTTLKQDFHLFVCTIASHEIDY